ncbi:ferritin [Flavobacteriales bacterium]|nr:ferritin [Flavobacteriales bacterium]
MLNKKVEKALNKQIQIEAESSQFYLAMASWAENVGYPGTSDFLYTHSEEERAHMLKLVKYVNERGGIALIPALKAPQKDFESLTKVFKIFLEHETMVTSEINKVVDVCLSEKDYTTHNFMQWYVSEQLEEEALARMILDKVKMIGEDKGGLYLFDRDIVSMNVPGSGLE